MRRCLTMVLALAFASPAMATINTLDVHELNKEEIAATKKRLREEKAFCRKARNAKGRIEKLGSLKKYDFDRKLDLVWMLESGTRGCPKDYDLAIAIVEPLVERTSWYIGSPAAMERLFELLEARGRPEDRARAAQLHPYLWVLGSNSVRNPPAWSDDERRAFVARDDVWKVVSARTDGITRGYLLHLDALLDPLSPRFDPMAGVSLLERQSGTDGKLRAAKLLLDGKLLPADRQRAEGLLWRIAGHTDEATMLLIDLHQADLASMDPVVRRSLVTRLAPFIINPNYPKSAALRARFVPFLVPDLSDPDPKIQSEAAARLATLGRQGTTGAVPPLLAWIDPRLASPDKAVADEAHGILKSLVMDGVGPARPLMDREFTRMGGLVEAGDWTPDPIKPVRLENYFTSNDYPTRALREEREGLVRADVVFGPDGRVFLVEIYGSSGSPDLDRAVQSILQRRMKRAWPEWPGRYVRVKLPPIQFRITGCDDEPPTPLREGGVAIDATRFCRQPDTTPVY